MKTIKHLALLLLTAILTYSCSKDAGVDPIIGTWQLTAVTITRNKEVTIQQLSECQMQTNFEFRADQTYTSTFFFTDDSNNCSPPNTPTQGTWENSEGDTYIITIESNGPTIESSRPITPKSNTFTIKSFDLFGG